MDLSLIAEVTSSMEGMLTLGKHPASGLFSTEKWLSNIYRHLYVRCLFATMIDIYEINSLPEERLILAHNGFRAKLQESITWKIWHSTS